ncbi:MAG: hypothetical protein U1D66_13980 [Erythrobacter sp.]|nr:hypothetical protein [Erythrobacter sp.]
MKRMAIVAAMIATSLSYTANAQTRVQAPAPPPQPPKPGFQATDIDPIIKRLNELQAEIKALRESAGKQVIVLHYTPTENAGWADNNWNANQERSTFRCKQALADRFGRVISYDIQMNGELYFFGNVLCETKP